MRIVTTFNDQKKAHLFSTFLTNEGIENKIEIVTDTDWGSAGYGDVACKIWVYDEDQVQTAFRWLEEFEKNPENPVFHESPKSVQEPIIKPLFAKNQELNPYRRIKIDRSTVVQERHPLGTITFYFLIVCSLLFGISEFTAPTIQSYPSWAPPTPIFSSPIKKKLLFDYPEAFEYIDKAVKLFGVEKLQSPQDLPPEGKFLVNQFLLTPYWQGFYEKILHYWKDPNYVWKFDAPLFEKIRQGEIWRAFTPCLLHSDLLHLFFNMIWLVILGKQMEKRMGWWKYLLFALITGVLSNTAQYLMSGSNFIGFSGILCAMLTFIWMRQKRAAWEGYLLQGTTMAFMMFFILTMFMIQIASFYLEAFQETTISPGIANTAHLTGAFLGVILGRSDFFSLK